eukprot:PhM_4_TR2091/c2_g3_i1/m.35923
MPKSCCCCCFYVLYFPAAAPGSTCCQTTFRKERFQVFASLRNIGFSFREIDESLTDEKNVYYVCDVSVWDFPVWEYVWDHLAVRWITSPIQVCSATALAPKLGCD